MFLLLRQKNVTNKRSQEVKATLIITLPYKMKINILLFLFSAIGFAQSEFRFNKKEIFTITATVDPVASFKEKGIDFVSELEYSGTIYAKVGIESFEALYGGYKDIHSALGLNFTSGMYEEFRYYGGIRLAKVHRGDSSRPLFGQELGIDYNLSDNLFIGLRFTRDKRTDQEIFNWKPEIKYSSFIRIGYKWDCKKNRY